MKNKQMEITKQYVKRYRQREFWRKIVSVLGCFVVFCTTYALILPAITMDQGTICGMIEHQHTSDCYLMPESGHVHTDACYTETVTYICGLEETAEDDGGFFKEFFADASSTSSAVEYEPAEPAHTHSDACIEISSELTCGLEEAVPHSHEDTCFDENGELICKLPTELEEPLLICDITPHIHSDGCFPSDEDNVVEEENTEPTEPELVCGKEAHQHEENCYDADGKLVCTIEEHTHADDCYTEAVTEETDEPETTEPACGKKEHQHMETCYDADSNLICALEEHQHDASCYPEELVYQNITALVYTDETCTELFDNSELDTAVKIEIKGQLPVAVFAKAYPVLVEQPDKEVLCAYDITLYREDNTVYEPTGDKNITVSIQTAELEDSLQDTEQPVEVYYVPEEGEPEPVESTITEEGIRFDTTHFSVYMVTRAATATNVFTYTSSDGKMTATVTLTGENPAYNSADYILEFESKDTGSYNTEAEKFGKTVAEAIGYTMYFTDLSGNRQWTSAGTYELEISWPDGIFQTVTEEDLNDICYMDNQNIATFQNPQISRNSAGNITGITISNTNPWGPSDVIVSRYTAPEGLVAGSYNLKFNTVRDAFITDPEYAECYNSNSPIGTAGSFHIVAFGKVKLSSHTNGNILAYEFDPNGQGFGTNPKDKTITELSYIQNYINIKSENSPDANDDGDILVVGSNHQMEIVNNGGSFAFDGVRISRPWHLVQDRDTTSAPFIDLNRVEREIRQISAKLSDMTANIEKPTGTEIKLADSSGVGVLNLTANELAELGEGNSATLQMTGFSAGKNGTIVVNVDCSGVSSINMPNAIVYVDGVEQKTDEVVEFSAGKIIWNFVNASGKTITTNKMTGMVIAPGATVNIESNLNGTVVAQNVNVNAESHRTDFTGTVVEPEDGKQPHQITIQKHETGYIANTVSGAEFKLYEYDNTKDAWVQIDDDCNPSAEILRTDSNGVIQLGGLEASVAYKLEEIKAPSGYIKSDTPFYFWIKAASTDTKPSEPANFSGSMISPGNTLFVPNDKNNSTTTSLQLEKIWKRSDGTVITGNDIPVNSITVNIYQLVNGIKPDNAYQTVTLSTENNWTVMLDNLPLKGRDANSNEVAYTYEVEENLTLNGYTVTYTETGTKITITNTAAGYELPETGGSGTQVYILAGMMLILASTVLLYNQNRHRRGNV